LCCVKNNKRKKKQRARCSYACDSIEGKERMKKNTFIRHIIAFPLTNEFMSCSFTNISFYFNIDYPNKREVERKVKEPGVFEAF
jgi:hypothetical protein